MATVVFQYAGSALGGLLGGPIGMMIGRAAGALAGSLIDSRLFATQGRDVKGPRLDDLRVMSSSEGAPIPVMWGRARLSGQVIWATDIEEDITTTEQDTGGKGGDTGSEITEYSYFANFAVGLCQGEISALGRVWADGKDLDLSRITWRLYTGSETQTPDSLIIAHQGSADAPAYRGLAYVVFERLPLAKFGNRIPQLSFEIIRRSDGVEDLIKAVAIIPGATEFGYDTQPIIRDLGFGAAATENTHTAVSTTDWTQSIDQLQDLCPKLETASLTVSWFGSDLRCGECTIEPRTDSTGKNTRPHNWSVAGQARDAAREVSKTSDGSAAFGGSPSDATVMRAIADLKARGLKVAFYPFLLMDIPEDNSLIDPYSGVASQPAYPWRGLITCFPAPGTEDSPDKTAAVDDQISAFFGTAEPAHFHSNSGAVSYSGPPEWGFRRFILHYAKLCQIAGGVDVFLIGSELPNLTRLRNSAVEFPVVAELVALAADVRTLLPSAKLSYGADWSEYFGYQPADGTGDVLFHLDPLWSSPNIDFIGIDNYFPLADWRDGAAHLDRIAGHRSTYSLSYLEANIEGGEGYDWYYPSSSHRDAQDRIAITDGAYGKPWVFRFKDLRNWWFNLHYDRPAGIESDQPTAWSPQSKPIWFTELGCPAVDKGANQPNCFYDPKSSQSALPYYSTGRRDDFMQRQYVEAVLSYWLDSTHNPVSSIYGAPMVDASRMFLWAWDARPFPAFPALSDTWADSANYERGHWLNGRLGGAPLHRLVSAIVEHFDFQDVDTGDLDGMIDGYVVDNIMSARDAIEPLARAFTFDTLETAGKLRFINRHNVEFTPLAPQHCIEQHADRPLYTLQRMQETELPASVKLTYIESGRDYRQAAVESRRSTGSSRRETSIALPAILSQATAQTSADTVLFDTWNGRESASFVLPPSWLRLEPGDGIALLQDHGALPLRIEEISEGYSRSVKARQLDSEIYGAGSGVSRQTYAGSVAALGPPAVVYMDLPLLESSSNEHGLWLAASSDPWSSGLSVYRKLGDRFDFTCNISAPSMIGETLNPLPVGPLWRRTRGTKLRVQLYRGALQSISEEELLNGGNLAAVGDDASGFEILQFEQANLVGPSIYEISTLLRGQLGSSPEMQAARPAGSSFILLDRSVTQLPMTAADLGLSITWRAGPASLSHGDASYREDVSVASGRALRPLPPCRLKARRSNGDVEFTWLRQTRMDGDSWELVEVPLGESFEQYVLEILDGEEVKRSVNVGQSSYLYAQADQFADFGSLPASFKIRVSQLSATYGTGASAQATLNV
jgi:Gene Transfer Agent (GTA)-like protein/putative tail protein